MRVVFCYNCSIPRGITTDFISSHICPKFISFNSEPRFSKHLSLKWPQRVLLHALTGALSFGLLVSAPFSSATESSSLQIPSPPSSEYCREEEQDQTAETAPDLVTNESIVEEAWEIVNDSFLDAGKHRWSPERWMQKREDVINSSIQTRSKAHDIIRRMLASLGDPYTRFISPSQGDEILSVNGVDVRGKSAFEVSSILQGPNETFVTIEVKHGNCGPIQLIEVRRQLVARSPVFYRLEEMENGIGSVGYLHLKEFNALARKDLVIAMKRLQDVGASNFILDLRDNLGGLVQVGIEVAKLFLNEGETVIYTVGRDPQFQKSIIADSAPMVTTPVIVLVNHNTASASEIVATALHDNCRAVLVGERTFGKGLIQSVFELHDGSGVVVTVGKYVTPNRMDINGNGIEPDFRSIPAWDEITKHLSQCHLQRQG
ncbi:carboxyl-terminal-processing peptidase 1, chloroplastic isoform X2 [Macadamia integrifolia]|uniref:carboxyl-terminal-processing peptidase 1, chloroplastic isoform X2 n=1 Tax=Macadamia integrifolia TaxID=60698 RepID=UPI001C500247|nr:carboxyl-terminal-processing peptidase 1, chloroplastic isoform X2 [Macadamia integrifolia]